MLMYTMYETNKEAVLRFLFLSLSQKEINQGKQRQGKWGLDTHLQST